MPVIPSDPPRHSTIVRIACNGVPLPTTAPLIALDTRHALDGEGAATLSFAVSPAEGDGGERMFLAAPLGAMLEVALGDRDPARTVFSGAVRAHRLQLASAGTPVMVLEAHSSSAASVRHDGIALTAQYGATLLALDAERATAGDAAVRLQGSAMLVGTPDACPGLRLALRGVGAAFEGDLRIVAVRQQVSNEGWTTRIDFRAGDETS